jgi:alkylhydroperoxidase family enzyme
VPKLPSAAVAAALLPATVPFARAEDAMKAPPSKSGIPYASVEQAPKDLVDAIRARRAGGKLLNLDLMLLHSPNYAKAWNTMLGTVRSQLSVPARLRELAIMAIGTLNAAEYEWAQHEKPFLEAGGTQEQLARLRNVTAALSDAKLFDEAERATLALTTEMTRAVKVKPATLKRIRAVLRDDQVVELAGTIAAYNMVSRFVVATGVEIEKPSPQP